MGFDEAVDLADAVGGHAEQFVRESAHIVGNLLALCPEGSPHLVGALPTHVGLKEHLQNQFAGFAPGAHYQQSLEVGKI